MSWESRCPYNHVLYFSLFDTYVTVVSMYITVTRYNFDFSLQCSTCLALKQGNS
uniref:Uncharacterized protein n=1 Tax=Oryza brachyantha TaxID=4533 RepID=J3MHY6_ORYBR